MQCINCYEETGHDYFLCRKCTASKGKARTVLIIGVLLTLCGSMTTASSYLSATTHKGSGFYVFYGLIAVGIINILKGISDILHFKKLEKNPVKYSLKSDINDGKVNEDALKRYLSNKNCE